MLVTAALLTGIVASFSSRAGAEFAAPENITSIVTSRSVYLTWNAVEEDGVLGYKLRLLDPDTGNEIQQAHASGTEAAFAGLSANTWYEVHINASNLNGTDGEAAVHEFRTNLGEIEEMPAIEATADTIDLEWEETDNVESLQVRITNDEDEPLDVEVSVFEMSVYISGLQTMTYYKIYVRAVGSDGRMSDETEIRTRTDGSGIAVTDWWESPDGGLSGEATIYKPLDIPTGLYRVRVQFPCGLQNWTFWNAYINMTASDPEDGFFLLFQNTSWQWKKTEIGVVFNYGLGALDCPTINENITVDFGEDVAPREESKRTEIPFERFEWHQTPTGIAPYAGTIDLQLYLIYHGTNVNDAPTNTTVQKPVAGSYVMVVDAGEACPGGLIIQNWWGMSRKNTVFLPEHKPNVYYFAQDKDNSWSNNNPGLLYGYNTELCPSRDNITSYVLEDSILVDTVYDTYDYLP